MTGKVPGLSALCHGGGNQLYKTICIKYQLDWDYQPHHRVSCGVTPGRLVVPEEDLRAPFSSIKATT